MDRCALFVDAGYVLADGAMAVHGTRHRESVSWDYAGLLSFMGSIARERTGRPLLRCYWYEAAVEGRRTSEHDSLADLPGLKLRLGRTRPGRREGAEGEIRRDLTTLARNNAISDALLVSAEDDLAQVVADVQDLGIRVTIVHITVGGNWTISRSLRQECDDIIEIGEGHLRPFTQLVAGTDALGGEEPYQLAVSAARALTNGHGPVAGPLGQQALSAGSHPAPPAIYPPPWWPSTSARRSQGHSPLLPSSPRHSSLMRSFRVRRPRPASRPRCPAGSRPGQSGARLWRPPVAGRPVPRRASRRRVRRVCLLPQDCRRSLAFPIRNEPQARASASRVSPRSRARQDSRPFPGSPCPARACLGVRAWAGSRAGRASRCPRSPTPRRPCPPRECPPRECPPRECPPRECPVPGTAGAPERQRPAVPAGAAGVRAGHARPERARPARGALCAPGPVISRPAGPSGARCACPAPGG